MSETKRLVVGLGNPGKEYERTRHNIGWMVLDRFEESLSLIWKDKFKGIFSQQDIRGEKLFFLKPQTFMNLSGESVAALINFFKISTEDILVIHDEIDLPFGTLTLKYGGGFAGHNGLKSIANHIGTDKFLRLRMGVGRPSRGGVSSFVLSGFSKDESISLDDFINGGAEVIECYIKNGFEKTASSFSKKNFVD